MLIISDAWNVSQATSFRLFETERVCRRQFQIWWNWQKVLQTGSKHRGKRRNCSLRAISPFPTVFSNDLYCSHVKTRACLGKVGDAYVFPKLSHTGTNTTFFPNPPTPFSHVLAQVRGENTPERKVASTRNRTTMSWVWHAQRWATRAGPIFLLRWHTNHIQVLFNASFIYYKSY